MYVNMSLFKLSINLLALKDATPLQVTDEKGQKVYGVFVPTYDLFVPKEGTSAHLMGVMVETPNNQFKKYGIKPYLGKTDWDSLTEDQKKTIPFIGSANPVEQKTPQAFAQSSQNAGPITGIKLPPSEQ